MSPAERKNRIVRTAAALLAGVAGCAHADVLVPPDADRAIASPREGVLSLRVGDVALATLADLLPELMLQEVPDAAPGRREQLLAEEPVFVLVLARGMDREAGALLEAGGVRTLGYLPTRALLADLSRADMAKIRPLLASVHRYEHAWKVDPELRGAQRAWSDPARRALAAEGLMGVSVWLFDGEDADGFVREVAKVAGARTVAVHAVGDGAGAQRVVDVAAPQASLDALAAIAGVQFIEASPEFAPRSNAAVRWVVQSNQVGVESLSTRGLTGAGQVLGVIDGWVATNHCAFADSVNPIGASHRKILAYNATSGFDQHGTHVACTALGDAGAGDDRRGVAYGARMVFNTWPSFGEQNVYNRFNLHRTQGAFIHTNSWGNGGTSAYDSTCVAIDRFSAEFEDNLVIFSVDNGALVMNPENAKNVLAVTGTQLNPNQGRWCVGGRGPTVDGRRKPEVASPGCGVVSASTQTGCNTTALTGTSMAAPGVAGLAVLTRQYFAEGFYPSGVGNASDARVPSGALLRAMLVNGAVDMAQVPSSGTTTPPFPNDIEGWGRVLGDNSLYFAGDARRLVVRDVRSTDGGALWTGNVSTIEIDVTDTAQAFKATLAFTDAPATAGVSFAPVNDLDLIVTSPVGAVYLGNAFVNGASASNQQGVFASDERNTIEQVLVTAPVAGRWRVDVLGSRVNVGPQGFALSVTGAVAEAPPTCGDIDFNNDAVYPDLADVVAFFEEFGGGGACAACDTIDFNRDGLFPDNADVEAFVRVMGGGGC